MSISDWINAAVALGTIAMAFYTRRAVRESKESIVASTKSAQAAVESTERMKDALRPYLDLDVIEAAEKGFPGGINTQDIPLTGACDLIIRNTGTGPARLGMMSHRSDLSATNGTDSIWCCRDRWYRMRIADTILAPGDEIIFLLTASGSPPKESEASSLSIFYEDVYTRRFRSRVIYTVKESRQNRVEYSVITKEMSELKSVEGYPLCDDVTKTHALEGGNIVKYNKTWEGLYRLQRIDELRTAPPLPGTRFTNNHPIDVRDISFDTSDFPSFTLKLGVHNEFVLDTWRTDSMRKFRILSNPKQTWPELGLNPTGDDQKDLAGLYHQVLTQGVEMDKVAAGLIIR